jgi:CHU_C Type IX secretion signal domain
MKRYFGIFLLLLVFMARLYAQKEDYTWIAAMPAVKMVFNDSGFIFDSTFKQTGGTYFFVTCFTMNDSSGNLLFYTDGASVYDRTGHVMSNGSGLNPSTYLNGLVASGVGNGMVQGAMGVQKPGSDSIYYLFHFTANDNCPAGLQEIPCVLYVTTINLKANNGLGAVVDKNRILLSDLILSNAELTLIKHGNGKDWWLIKQAGYFYNRYCKFLITSYTIEGPFFQDIGTYPGTNTIDGTATISPDGYKFAGITATQKANVFDFDRCTGEFSNPDTFSVENYFNGDSITSGLSLAFSPNSRFLYVNSRTKIYQYDLHATDIEGSAVLLKSLTDTSNGIFQWLEMQLAPDGKIYLSPYDGYPYLSVINYPDSPGLACGFVPWSLALPCAATGQSFCAFSIIPLFPQYRLPTLPVYLVAAGTNKQTCKDTLVQVGSNPLATQLIYNWSSNDPNAYISDTHNNQPLVSTLLDSAQFYLQVTDTVSKHGCVTRADTVIVRTNLCTIGILETGTPMRVKDFPYLYIYNLTPQTSVTIYNLLGQLIYTSSNYQNDWDVRTATNAVYVYQIKTPDGLSYNGKVVLVH